MLGTRATTTTVGKLLWIKKNIETAATSRKKNTLDSTQENKGFEYVKKLLEN